MPCHLWREFRDSSGVEVEGRVDVGEMPLRPFAHRQGFEAGVTCKINQSCLLEPALEFAAREGVVKAVRIQTETLSNSAKKDSPETGTRTGAGSPWMKIVPWPATCK